jgi:hypothetical protein
MILFWREVYHGKAFVDENYLGIFIFSVGNPCLISLQVDFSQPNSTQAFREKPWFLIYNIQPILDETVFEPIWA